MTANKNSGDTPVRFSDSKEQSDTTDSGSDSETWSWSGDATVASAHLPPYLHTELDAIHDDMEGIVILHPSDPHQVNIDFTVSVPSDPAIELGGIVALSPAKAEQLAESLLACADQARNLGFQGAEE